jgi:hypothetical protein
MSTNLVDVNAVYGLNKYVWALLQKHQGLNTNQYGGKVPIIPAHQEPKIKQYGRLYLVYGFSEQPTGVSDWIHRGEVAYTIYGEDTLQVDKTVDLIARAGNRFELSAKDINNYIHGTNDSTYHDYDTIFFHHVELSSAMGTGDIDEEGGEQGGLVVLSYSYAKTINQSEFAI